MESLDKRTVSPATLLLEDIAAHQKASYELGSIYESKSRLGKFVMRLTWRGSRHHELEMARLAYGRSHFREQAIRAHNEEVIKSWSK